MTVSTQALKRKQDFDVPQNLTAGGQLTVEQQAAFESIVELAQDPAEPLEAATKKYVDAMKQGLDPKDSVRVATTDNIADLSAAENLIDEVEVTEGDRVLVKEQSEGTENGIYFVDTDNGDGTVALVRSEDADEDNEVTAGIYTFVEEGNVNGDNGFVLVTDDPIVVGSDPMEFVQFSGAGQIIPGTALYKDGNEIGVGDSDITDVLIGDRTVDDTAEPADTAKLAELLGALANRIKAITGEDDWKDAPATALALPDTVQEVNVTENGHDVEVAITLPDNRDRVNAYEVYKDKGANGNFELFKVIEDQDIAEGDTEVVVVDEDVEANGDYAYRAYALNEAGIRSASQTNTVTTTEEVADPTNVNIYAGPDYYNLEFDKPEVAKFEEAVIKMDAKDAEVDLAEGDATEIYRGNRDNLLYEIEDGNEEKYHQFWIESVTKEL